MELSVLKEAIISAFTGDPAQRDEILHAIEQDHAIYPFNEYEHLLHHLIHLGGLTYQDYLDIRADYIRSNPNLWIFEISAPRGFGEKFAQTLVLGMCPELKKPGKALDPAYSGEYDFRLDNVRIEVKASRAVDGDSDGPLYTRALSFGTKHRFDMNFQQLKPACCDVFIWVAVFRDQTVTWVLNTREVSGNKYYSGGQHRGNHGNEGQLHIKHDNIAEFEPYRLTQGTLKSAIIAANDRRDVIS